MRDGFRTGIAALCVAAFVAAPHTSARPLAAPAQHVFFDDLSYAGTAEFGQRGWKIRTTRGWPGIRGATWSARNVTFVSDPANPRNRVLRMTSSTDGTRSGTSQTQICHERKYLEGTYATRVRFRDAPTSGPDGDEVVETFYAISPLEAPLDPSYSELDWEYLANGGWGTSGPTLFVTSWEKVRIHPWLADNTHDAASASHDGWHTLVMQVVHGRVTYYVDGDRLGTHGARYFPEVPMSINYNLWFINDGLLAARATRRYSEDVDWVFHEAGASLSPAQVVARVAKLRRAKVAFTDSVAAAAPPLISPCAT